MWGARTTCLAAVLLLGALARAAVALDLALPGQAELTHEDDTASGTYFLPVGAFADGGIDTLEVEGRVTRQAWQIMGSDLTTLQLMTPVRDQLIAEGYEILFDCTAQECGGFDFRFNTDVLPAPDMFVDLFDFRFLSARKQAGDGPQYLSGLVSLSGQAGYVQLIAVGVSSARVIAVTPDATPQTAPQPVSKVGLIDQLTNAGHVVLSDLEFATGSSALSEGPYPSLSELAKFLMADVTRRVALVGHTDAVGSLEANVALSQRRAASVLERLAERYGVLRAQMESNGMGYLSPIAANTTPDGREANRRVEAVLLNTE